MTEEEPASEGASEPSGGTVTGAEADSGAASDSPAHTEPAAGHESTTRRSKYSLRSQLLIAVLTAALGFGIVVQVREIQSDDLANMRQDDLVKLLDEVTRRQEDLTAERSQLRVDRSQLQSGSDQSDYLRNYATLQEILSGAVAVQGPGIQVVVRDPGHEVAAHEMVHMLEELRNAGAEAISVGEVRLVAGSYFIDTAGGILADGELLTPPYRWKAIGNASTLSGALEIPGGAFASFRNAGASASMVEKENLEISATRTLEPMEFATPATETE